jgi:hypothetical protein
LRRFFGHAARECEAKMNWRLLTRGDIAAIVLLLALLAFLFFSLTGKQRSNLGFGPEWECTYPGGEPVCVKKRPAKTEKSN